MIAPFPPNEDERLEALYQCAVLDTTPEDAYDDIVQLAAQLCDVPIAAVSLVDAERQWFKSIIGLDVQETSRDAAFCAHTILQSEVMVVPDACQDTRFADNPLVIGATHLRFYAGAPLLTSDGYPLGSLCVIDRAPRQFTEEQRLVLRLLASHIATRLERVRRSAQQDRLDEEREQSERERLRLAAIVETSSDAIWSATVDGSIVSWNAGAEKLYGYPRSEILGQHARILMPVEETNLIAEAIALLERGEPCQQREARRKRKDGVWVDVSPTFSPIQNSTGQMIGISCIARDITLQKRQEEGMRRSEARLAEAQRVAQIGSWEYEVATGRITWSEELFRLFGLDPTGEEPSVEELLTHYHPADRAMHIQITEQAIHDGAPYEFDIRILAANGGPRWAHAVGCGERDAQGQVIRLYGTLMDIHDRHMSEERFRLLFEQSSHAHLLFDEQNGILDCNKAALKMVHCTGKDQILGIHPALLSPDRQADGQLSGVKGAEMCAIARRDGEHRFEWTRRTLDGHEYPVEVTLTPVILDDRPILLSVWHDLTERKHAEQEAEDYRIVLEFQKKELEAANAALEAMATTDGLTGLLNHRAFQERLAEEISRTERYNKPLSLMMLDVDYFKRYNDTHGHPAGDEVLRRIAETLRDSVRETDWVARYGGEEFVVILPQTDQIGAQIIAERIRATIAVVPWPRSLITVSIGVAAFGISVPDQATLIARADSALYQSKNNGRDQITCQ
jgi:diguanylate cyclase (GGDEF)-like protein/PAS domain S-box-containing protein